MIHAGIIEYGAILAVISEINLTSLTSFEPSMNVILIVGGFLFFIFG